MSEQNEELWGIVELFGHQRIAGKLSEHSLGGNFLRIDVPALNGFGAFTKLIGEKAVYAINFVDRDTCLAAIEKLRIRPVTPYDLASITTDSVRERLEYYNEEDTFPL